MKNMAKGNCRSLAFAFGLSASNMKKSLNHLDSPVKGIRGVDGGPQNCHGATMDHTYIQVTVKLKKNVQFCKIVKRCAKIHTLNYA